jgi:hypothetical protein
MTIGRRVKYVMIGSFGIETCTFVRSILVFHPIDGDFIIVKFIKIVLLSSGFASIRLSTSSHLFSS